MPQRGMPETASPLPTRFSVLGFATVGLCSHQMLLIKIGRELIARGHKFGLLLSAHDTISRAALENAKHIQLLTFEGHADSGTHNWAARMPQTPAEVLRMPDLHKASSS